MKSFHILCWTPSPLMLASFFLFAGAVGLSIMQLVSWPWALGAVIANYSFLSALGLWPRSKLLGKNWTHLPQECAQRGQIAITIDDGPDPLVTPQVLDILDRYGAKATFFCIGKLAQRHADLCREIVQRGHTVENHSQQHNYHFSLFGPRRTYHEIQAAQDTLHKITGHYPQFFRPAAGLRNPLLDPILACADLHLVSWTRRGFDTRESNADIVLRRLTDGLRGGDILLLHDGNSAKTSAGTPVIIDVLPRLLEKISAANLHPVTLNSLCK